MIDILLGPEEGMKNEKIKELKKLDRALHSDMEEKLYIGGEDESDELYSDLNEGSLFSSFKFVTIKHFENAKKSDRIVSVIDEFSKNDSNSVHLVISTSDLKPTNLPSSLQDKIKSAEKFYELYESQKKDIILRRARERGYFITEDGINEILRSVENTKSEIISLLDMIIDFIATSDKEKKKITGEDIERYTSRAKDEDGYSLFSSMMSSDLENSILISKSILLNDPQRIVSTFSLISNQFRLLEAVISDYEESGDLRDTFKNVTYFSLYAPKGKERRGVFFKEEEMLRRGLSNYTLQDVKSIILYLGRMDSEIKSANQEILPILLDKIIYDIVIGKGKDKSVDIDPVGFENPFRN